MSGTFEKNTGLIANKTINQSVSNWGGEVLLPTRVTILDEDGFAIGFITNFNPSDARATEEIRHISHADAGRIIEQAPKPALVSINVTGFALYNTVNEKGSLIQRLGAWNPLQAMKSLAEQHYGFTVLVVEKDPKTDKTVDATEYEDCWLQNFSRPYNITGATIADTATIKVSRQFRPSNWANL